MCIGLCSSSLFCFYRSAIFPEAKDTKIQGKKFSLAFKLMHNSKTKQDINIKK